MNKPERETGFIFSSVKTIIGVSNLSAEDFRETISALSEAELPGYLRSHVRSRVPAAFATQPLLWEAIRNWIAMRVRVDPHEIGLSGSAQLGFSSAPQQFGRAFSSNRSDLDFFIVNGALFDALAVEIRQFCSKYGAATASRYWDQVETLRRTESRGFFDLKQIPADHDKYPRCADMNNRASIVVDKLKRHQFVLKHSFFRVYRSWHSFSNQTTTTYLRLRNTWRSAKRSA